MRIKNELPIVHRIIYRCPPDEYIVLRRLFCMFGGYLVCKLLLILCVELPQTPEDKDSIFIHKWGLVIMIIGFVFSVQIRTVICLLLPSLIITSNGIFFYLRLVQRTQHVLLPSVIGNIRALWSMISCLINFRKFFFSFVYQCLICFFSNCRSITRESYVTIGCTSNH